MSHARAAVILAAGKSTRMKSTRSKVLHHVGGRSMLAWVTDLARQSGVTDIVCVVGESNADVRAEAESLGLKIAIQEPQMGTGHAVKCAKEAIGDFDGNLAILYADTPLIEIETVKRVFSALEGDADVAVLGFEPEEPGAYGRLVTENGELTAIVEAKEASEEILAIKLCNSGVIGANATDMFSALERVIESGAVIGPFARLRPGTVLKEDTKIGNFVETKKTTLGKGSKINHLSYIGDAELGDSVNVGAGTITCNYDGYFKHKTIIEDGAFIGTNSSLVAPITIGKGAFLGSGGVITENVPAGALALARSKQVNKDSWADRYNKAQSARKSKLKS